MGRKPILGLLAVVLALVLGGATYLALSPSPDEAPFEPRSTRIETAPLCPWRQPAEDLRVLFPEATRHQAETRILSGLRIDLAQQLGRTPTAEENSLQLHRVYHDQQLLGTVLMRRVKGEFGAIEVVLGVRADGRVQGVRLQRLREPEAVAAALQNPEWLGTFRGRTLADRWMLGNEIPDVPVGARADAQAVVEGVRSLLVLLETAQKPNVHVAHAAH